MKMEMVGYFFMLFQLKEVQFENSKIEDFMDFSMFLNFSYTD